MRDRLKYTIVFTDGDTQVFETVTESHISDGGVLTLLDSQPGYVTVHLGSFPLVNIKSWRRELADA